MTYTFSKSDAVRIGQLISMVAAAEILPRFYESDPESAVEKTSSFDVVTAADEAAEREIGLGLLSLYPGAVILGEEAVGRDPELMHHIETAEVAFVVDPLDGTKNFSGGVPLFGVMVAAVCRGEVVLGVIHDPVCQTTYYAVRGQGAWRQHRDGQTSRLAVAPPVPVSEMQCVVGTNFLPSSMRKTVTHNLEAVQLNFWFRCAATEYRMASSGQCHVLLYNRLMPWDHAAGWLLHQEAGGFSAHFDGSAYRPSHLIGGLICAPDEESWVRVRDALFRS